MKKSAPLNKLISRVRSVLLGLKNRKAMAAVPADLNATGTCPAFVIASPPDLHLAPKFIKHLSLTLPTCILANGADDLAADWLRSKCGAERVIQLQASLSRNQNTYLAHADVVQLACERRIDELIICDADCYVSNAGWIRSIPPVQPAEYAVGPFGKGSTIPGIRIPDTYFCRISAKRYLAISKSTGIDASILEKLPKRLQTQVDKALGQHIASIEPGKTYFDTFQAFWLTCILKNLKFREIPGEGTDVFHIGGSSYLLTDRDFDMLHWDCWAANTIFFHLRFAELANDPFITGRLAALFRRHTGSDAIVKKIPQLTESWRYSQSIRILKELFTD
jgi:hypothetical protein